MTDARAIDLTPDDVRRRMTALRARERRWMRLLPLVGVPLGLALGWLLAQVTR